MGTMKHIKLYENFYSNEKWLNKHYKSLDDLYENGGIIYRIIYSIKPIENFNNISDGHFWTYDKDMIYKQINLSMSQSFEDELTIENSESEIVTKFYAYLITGVIPPKAFNLEYSKEKSLEMELEVFFDNKTGNNIQVVQVEKFLIESGDYSLKKDSNYEIFKTI
jgi:hypothetical protein